MPDSESFKASSAYFGFVVRRNGVSAGINGSFSAAENEVHQNERKNCEMVKIGAHLRFCVSKMRLSTSQCPRPGPPRRDLEGSTRFCRLPAPGVDQSDCADEFASIGIAVTTWKVQHVNM